jgi:hypothetical protein
MIAAQRKSVAVPRCLQRLSMLKRGRGPAKNAENRSGEFCPTAGRLLRVVRAITLSGTGLRLSLGGARALRSGFISLRGLWQAGRMHQARAVLQEMRRPVCVWCEDGHACDSPAPA